MRMIGVPEIKAGPENSPSGSNTSAIMLYGTITIIKHFKDMNEWVEKLSHDSPNSGLCHHLPTISRGIEYLKKYINFGRDPLQSSARILWLDFFACWLVVFFCDQNTDRYKTRGAGKLLYKNGTENKTLDSGWFEKSLFELVFSPPGGRGRAASRAGRPTAQASPAPAR